MGWGRAAREVVTSEFWSHFFSFFRFVDPADADLRAGPQGARSSDLDLSYRVESFWRMAGIIGPVR